MKNPTSFSPLVVIETGMLGITLSIPATFSEVLWEPMSSQVEDGSQGKHLGKVQPLSPILSER